MLDFEYSKKKKIRKEIVINAFLEELYKGTNATSKRTVRSVVNGAYTLNSNAI